MKNLHSETFGQSSLNTLAQSGTTYTKPCVIIQGEGSELGNEKFLKGKAKRKVISQALALNLLSIAEKKEDHARKQAFWNSYHCQNRIYSYNGRLHGKYCKNRFCTLCSAVRKAEIINRYYPVLREWKQPYFVTLTVKSCSKKRLPEFTKALIRGFRRITTKYRKQDQRGTGTRLIGIKSLECNFNPVKKTYNPHLHLIVASKEIANILIVEWLKLWTPSFTNRKAQHAVPVYNLEKGLIEIIKYGSKIFTEPEVDKNARSKGNGTIYAAALYNIFEAMKGLRIFERFGFDLPKTPKERTGAKVVNEYGEWVFDARFSDWLDIDSELTLCSYQPTPQLLSLLVESVNVELD